MYLEDFARLILSEIEESLHNHVSQTKDMSDSAVGIYVCTMQCSYSACAVHNPLDGKRHPYLAITWNLYGVPVLQGTLPRRACENSTWDVMGNPNKRVSVNKFAKFLNRV
ncbi:hypothetical protein D8B26_002232 [Coccidioides posadasii str. Silveira]|nr:hypothetical protein D8B26_002232 [Coccidioides posadasii str. Silveira]